MLYLNSVFPKQTHETLQNNKTNVKDTPLYPISFLKSAALQIFPPFAFLNNGKSCDQDAGRRQCGAHARFLNNWITQSLQTLVFPAAEAM